MILETKKDLQEMRDNSEAMFKSSAVLQCCKLSRPTIQDIVWDSCDVPSLLNVSFKNGPQSQSSTLGQHFKWEY